MTHRVRHLGDPFGRPCRVSHGLCHVNDRRCSQLMSPSVDEYDASVDQILRVGDVLRPRRGEYVDLGGGQGKGGPESHAEKVGAQRPFGNVATAAIQRRDVYKPPPENN